MPSIAFFAPCVPPTATSQGKGAFIAGKTIRFFKKTRQKQAENTLWAILQPHRPQDPFSGPLSLVLTFRYPWRKSERKAIQRRFSLCPIATRPDVDNLAKACIDVMTTLGYWRDDGQIASLCLHKEYADTPGISVTLTNCLGTTREGTQAEVA